MACARRALPRPGERLPEGGQGAGARARAEAAPGAETLQAGDRKTHREARAAGEIGSNIPTTEPPHHRAASASLAARASHPGRGLEAAEPDARRDREMRRLVAQEFAGLEVAEFEEQRSDTADAADKPAAYVPGKLGL